MRIRAVGTAALLVELDDASGVEPLRAELWRGRSAGEFAAEEIVPGARTVLIDGLTEPDALATRLAGWSPPVGAGSAEGELIEIPTVYDGPDLLAVATLWGTDVNGVVARHVATEFRVAFCGFAPGFGYLTGLPHALAVPRLATPRSRVPAGSVALADTYCGVYPSASPGGWRLIGRTDVVLFDVGRVPPAVLTPGTRVRFVPADAGRAPGSAATR